MDSINRKKGFVVTAVITCVVLALIGLYFYT